MGAGINALHKSDDLKDFVHSNAPPGVRVDINDNDVFSSGTVVTIFSGLLALTSLITLVLLLLFRRSPKPLLMRLSAALHLFFAIWIFGALIPFDAFTRNRSARVAAFIGDTQLPDSIVQQQQQALGVSAVYWDQDYLRILAILPWFAILFGVIAAIVLFRGASAVRNGQGYGHGRAAPGATTLGDKDSVEKHEEVQAAPAV